MKTFNANNVLAKIIILAAAIVLGIVITSLLFEKTKAAIAISAGLLVLSLGWYFAPRADVKKVIMAFFFIYPMLPCMAGFQIASGIPVFRTQRIATIVILLFLIRRGLLIKYVKGFVQNKIFIYPLLFLVLTLLISSFLSYNFTASIFYVVSLVVESMILAVIAFNAFVTDEEINSLVSVMCWSAIVLSVLGVYEYLFHDNIFFAFGVFDRAWAVINQFQVRYDEIRIQGPFDHSIAFAGYLVGSLPLILYKYRDRIVHFNLYLGLVCAAILMTQSRAGLIGLIIVYALYFIFVNRRDLLISLVLGLLVLIPNLQSIFQHYMNIDDSLRSEYFQSERTRQFYFLMNYIKDNIIFGWGMIETPAMMLSDVTGQYRSQSTSIDNYYLLFAFHWGAAGLLADIIWLASMFLRPILEFRAAIMKNKLLILMLIAIIALSVINVVVALWSFQFLLWIYMGVIARMIVNHRNKESKAVQSAQPTS